VVDYVQSYCVNVPPRHHAHASRALADLTAPIYEACLRLVAVGRARGREVRFGVRSEPARLRAGQGDRVDDEPTARGGSMQGELTLVFAPVGCFEIDAARQILGPEAERAEEALERITDLIEAGGDQPVRIVVDLSGVVVEQADEAAEDGRAGRPFQMGVRAAPPPLPAAAAVVAGATAPTHPMDAAALERAMSRAVDAAVTKAVDALVGRGRGVVDARGAGSPRARRGRGRHARRRRARARPAPRVGNAAREREDRRGRRARRNQRRLDGSALCLGRVSRRNAVKEKRRD
jgi:hypothetical protein